MPSFSGLASSGAYRDDATSQAAGDDRQKNRSLFRGTTEQQGHNMAFHCRNRQIHIQLVAVHTAVSVPAEELQLIIFYWYFMLFPAEEFIQIPPFKQIQLHKTQNLKD